MITGNEPINPLQYEEGKTTYDGYGLTIRQYYAGLAMQGLIGKAYVKGSYQEFSEIAVAMADALIKELNK